MKKICILALLASLLSALPVHAEAKMSEETRKKTALALEWLAKQQNPDGSFSDGGYSHNPAITAFAMLAFMSQGQLPNQGKHGPEVARAAKFLMGAQRADGYIVGASGSGNMYCHGMATLALSELWGQTGSDEIKPCVQKAIELIMGCQSVEGGWRYNPTHKAGADISLTIMQVMALRSAKNAGLHVKDETLKNAIKYIKKCERKISDTEVGFSYQPGGSPGFARTAAGTCVLYLTGEYKAAEIEPAVNYLKKHFDASEHFYYGHYYAAHAMHQWGGTPKGAKDWEDWYKRLENHFLPTQEPDGSWRNTSRKEVGPVYQTSIAVIVLSVPANYLPSYTLR